MRRLSAEEIHDSVLAITGALDLRIGGPSVYPVQPSHIGEFRDDTAGKWMTSPGAGRYRRSIYTYWQRMYPYPSLNLFDAPSGERSCVRRNRSNTPLQALVLLNDPVFFEAARAFGGRMLLEAETKTDSARLQFAFEVALSRTPTKDEMKMFLAFVQKQRHRFKVDAKAAEAVIQGRRAQHAKLPVIDLATWTMVGSTLLAMDETISKQ